MNPLRTITLKTTPTGAAGAADGTVYSAEIRGWLVAWHLDVPAALTSNGGTVDLWCGYPIMFYSSLTGVRSGASHSEKWYYPRIAGQYDVSDTGTANLNRLDLGERFPIFNWVALSVVDGSPVEYTAEVIYEEVPF